jgi:cytoskeletal protein RodZ
MDEQVAFGTFLRGERELRQIPLSEVAAATKIPLRTLQRLEQGIWGDLPAQVFVRGFVRSYARHLGMSVDEADRRYESVLVRLSQAENDANTEAVGDYAAEVHGRRRFGLALFLIIILIIATITLSLIWGRGASADAQATHSSHAAQQLHA